MFIPEINEIKEELHLLQSEGLVANWELPHENLLTRRSAAIFFLTPGGDTPADTIWNRFRQYEYFSKRPNTEKKLSHLEYRLSFNKEEKEKNENQ